MQIPDIYKYEDVKQYLADLYDFFKAKDSSFSQRELARRAGFSNPGLLNDLIKGRRKISSSTMEKLQKVFSIKGSEKEYFKMLIEFCQTKSLEDKKVLYSRMSFRRSRSGFAKVSPELVKYYKDWRYPLIRGIIDAHNPKWGSWKAIGDSVYPKLSAKLVETVVGDLLDWSLIKKEREKLFTTQTFLEPSATLGYQVRQLNKEWFSQVSNSLDDIEAQDRHVSTVFFAGNSSLEQRVQERLEALRKEVLEWAETEEKTDTLYQLSLGFIPRTAKSKKGSL
jgi:uncharacterized protein (TIGR02147 family)